jgi:glycerol-3-phosphate dehydrogenase
MKIKREEKALIKAYVNFMKTKHCICPNDADWLESEVTSIIGNKNMDYRYMVEDYITALLADRRERDK